MKSISHELLVTTNNPNPHPSPEKRGSQQPSTQGLRERYEADIERAEFLQGAYQIQKRSAPTIQAPDENGVELAAASGRHHRFSLGSVFGTGADFFHVHDDAPAAAFGVRTQRGQLRREGLLIVGGDAGIEPNPQRSSPGQKPLQNQDVGIPHFPGFAFARPALTNNYSLVPDVGTLFGEALPRTVSTSSGDQLMSDITMVGLDLAKNVFQLHGVDAHGHQRLARQVRRAQLMSTVAQLPPCTIAMEACAGAHGVNPTVVSPGAI